MSERKPTPTKIRDYVNLYVDPKTGIAWVEDGRTGMGHSAHPNIHASGSVAGMKNPRHVSGRGAAWGKHDRTVKSHGFIYNIDECAVSGDLDEIARKNCRCGGNHARSGARHGESMGSSTFEFGKLGPGMAAFGQERTVDDCKKRIAWERRMAKEVRKRPYGEILAAAHENSAAAYENYMRRLKTDRR